MNEKENLTKKFKLVDMKEVDISTLEKPIIGTEALASCVGILLYNIEQKRAIVAHSTSDWEPIKYRILELMVQNNFGNSMVKYKVIRGFYPDNDMVAEKFEKIFNSLKPMFVPFNEEEIPEDGIRKNNILGSFEFAFDTSSGKFVTDKVLFGEEYFKICPKENEISMKRR